MARTSYRIAVSSLAVWLLVATALPVSAQDGPAPDVTAASENDPAGDGSNTPTHGLFEIIFAGGWIGLLIILLLVALSLTAAYLVFEQAMTLRRAEIMPEGMAEHVRSLIASGHRAEAEHACRAEPSFLGFVLLHGISEIDGPFTAVEKALEDAVAEQTARLYRKVEYLSVIGNIAPMVGLLGTVIGMIFAFQQVATTQGTAGAADLAEGIYQALVTTVGGLLVAIPSLGAFAVLRNRVDQLVAEAAYMAMHVFAPLKRQRTAPAGPAQPVAQRPQQPRSPKTPPPPPPPGQGGR